MSANESDAVFLRQMVQISSYGELSIETVDRISTGAECLRCDEFDVVLMDLQLVDTSGLDSFATLASLAPRIPIVVVVGIEDEQWAQQAVRCGAQDYLIRQQVTPHSLAHSLRCAVERHRQLLQLRDLSMTDHLTGLLNRRGFWALAESHLRMTRRQRKRSLLLSADLDGLKEINDSHGHDEGDRAISRTAELLKSCFRESDIVARFGGDEFVALAFAIDEFGEVALRQKIEDCLALANETSELDYDLSLSIGTTEVTGSGKSIEELLREADQALYREKAKRPSHRIVAKKPKKTKAKRRRRSSPSEVLAVV
jgi:diguanylate cyclase (GGDEF)-like protein